MDRKTIAIVGGGASGALVATRLLRAGAGLRIVIVEPDQRLARGVAYGTSSPRHLLNVRAAGMSAYPEAPGHFADWLRDNVDAALTPDCFAPRHVYGDYLEAQLREAQRAAPPDVSLEHVRSRVVGASRGSDGAVLELQNGARFKAHRVVVALGNPPPSNPLSWLDCPAPLSPWTLDLRYGLGEEIPVLLVGSGLTAVDVILSLDESGHRGPIHVVSRHGHWPLIHGASPPLRSFMGAEELPDSVAEIAQVLRLEARAIVDDGGSWRSVIDGLRPYTNAVWARLDIAEKRRYLRHLRPYWDIHRHRMAPGIARTLAALCCQDRVVLHAARITGAQTKDGALEVAIRERGSGETRTLSVGQVINCTGPEADYRKIDQPLMRSLFEQEIAVQDPLHLGLLTSDIGALIGGDGKPSRIFFTLGPPRKGTLFETTAMPEIRVQAATLAGRLIGEFS